MPEADVQSVTIKVRFVRIPDIPANLLNDPFEPKAEVTKGRLVAHWNFDDFPLAHTSESNRFMSIRP